MSKHVRKRVQGVELRQGRCVPRYLFSVTRNGSTVNRVRFLWLRSTASFASYCTSQRTHPASVITFMPAALPDFRSYITQNTTRRIVFTPSTRPQLAPTQNFIQTSHIRYVRLHVKCLVFWSSLNQTRSLPADFSNTS